MRGQSAAGMALRIQLIWFLILAVTSSICAAKTLPIGLSLDMSGPDAQTSLEFKNGIEALILSENRSKRFGNYALKLIALDDKNQPHRTLSNAKRLIKSKKILTLLSTHSSSTVVELAALAGNTKTLLLAANHPQQPLKIKQLRYLGFLSEPYQKMFSTLKDTARHSHSIYLSTDNNYDAAVLEDAVRNVFRKTAQSLDVDQLSVDKNCTIILANQFAITASLINKLAQKQIKCTVVVLPNVEKTLLMQVLVNKYQLELTTNLIFLDSVPLNKSNLFIVEKFKSDLRAYNPQAAITYQAFKGYLLAKLAAESIYTGTNKVQAESLIDIVTLPFQVLDQVVGWVMNPNAASTRATVVNSFSYIKHLDLGLENDINITKDRVIIKQTWNHLAKDQLPLITDRQGTTP